LKKPVASIQQLIIDNSLEGKWDFLRFRATKTLTAFVKCGIIALFGYYAALTSLAY
jgi:hypothetical protein